ncbi:hypothetical protein BT96DRAFT_938871 [Gymnopus androsaceus JB14]|uniref:MYND-type domain-containing protein n=1 Tax=Gymnopus androsaceus JB14 TaxID=1447944 RepID=A0A6A4HQJ2_9AGAR|nr:hypothetical protein BT96DRAFT_938871 [Gymnopus androsaceus JB14]
MENSNRGKLLYSIPELFGNLVGLVQASTIYRSVHKPLERLLSKAPLNEIVGSIDGSDEPEHLWGRFKSLVEYRSDLRKELEVTEIKLCSNVECKALPNTKVFRCSRCKIAFYCGHSCHRFDWIRGHRERCIDWVKKLEDRPVDVMINFLDFSTPEQQLVTKIRTLNKARTLMPDVNWDIMVDEFLEKKQLGQNVGPIVIAKIAHPRQAMHLAFTLTKPNVRLPARLEQQAVEDEMQITIGDHVIHSSNQLVRTKDGGFVNMNLGVVLR